MNDRFFEVCMDFDKENKAFENVLNRLKRVFDELDEKEKIIMINLIGDEKVKRLILFGKRN